MRDVVLPQGLRDEEQAIKAALLSAIALLQIRSSDGFRYDRPEMHDSARLEMKRVQRGKQGLIVTQSPRLNGVEPVSELGERIARFHRDDGFAILLKTPRKLRAR